MPRALQDGIIANYGTPGGVVAQGHHACRQLEFTGGAEELVAEDHMLQHRQIGMKPSPHPHDISCIFVVPGGPSLVLKGSDVATKEIGPHHLYGAMWR
jgi:hypothetical protein